MILANDTYPTQQTRLINPAPSKQQQQASRCHTSSSQAAAAVSTTTTNRTRVRTGSLLPYFLHPATAASMATTKTTTLTITSSTAIPSPPPRGALRRAPSPSSPGSSSSGRSSDAASSSPKKSATFCADLARDLQTGELVPPQTGDGTGAEYRAWFRARRQVEQRRQSVREQADRDFDHAMQRLIFVVAR